MEVAATTKNPNFEGFWNSLEQKPISVILTTLAAEVYEGETQVSDMLEGFLSRMGQFVRMERPRVPNSVNPAEDFAGASRPAICFQTGVFLIPGGTNRS